MPNAEETTVAQVPDQYTQDVYFLRNQIEQVAQQVKALKSRDDFNCVVDAQGEMCANVMLAFRHLEDAKMQLGKVLQAKDGGVSIYKN